MKASHCLASSVQWNTNSPIGREAQPSLSLGINPSPAAPVSLVILLISQTLEGYADIRPLILLFFMEYFTSMAAHLHNSFLSENSIASEKRILISYSEAGSCLRHTPGWKFLRAPAILTNYLTNFLVYFLCP